MQSHKRPVASAADEGPAAVWLCLSKLRGVRDMQASTAKPSPSPPVPGPVKYFTKAEMEVVANGDGLRVRRGRSPAFFAHWSLYIRGEHYEIKRDQRGSWPLYFERHSKEKSSVYYMEMIGMTSMSNDAIAVEGTRKTCLVHTDGAILLSMDKN